MRKINQRTLGRLWIGEHQIKLIGTTMDAGEARFTSTPKNHGLPRIWIGCKGGVWEEVVGAVTHEAFEYACCLKGVRFHQDLWTEDSNNCLFVFDHIQFTQITAMATHFIHPALPLLRKYYDKVNR